MCLLGGLIGGGGARCRGARARIVANGVAFSASGRRGWLLPLARARARSWQVCGCMRASQAAVAWAHTELFERDEPPPLDSCAEAARMPNKSCGDGICHLWPSCPFPTCIHAAEVQRHAPLTMAPGADLGDAVRQLLRAFDWCLGVEGQRRSVVDAGLWLLWGLVPRGGPVWPRS